MQVAMMLVSPFQQNCSVLMCEATRGAVLIDPGADLDKITQMVTRLQAQVEKVLLTHAHIDHCGAARQAAQYYQVPIYGPHQDDLYWLERLPLQAEQFGFAPVAPFVPDYWLADQEHVRFGQETLKVLHCPGHTPGHIIFFSEQHRRAWVGDVLFRGSIGRTDFPLGDHAQLLHSIRAQLWPLGDDVQFIPGHGAMSSFGHERRTNPYVADGI